VVFANEWMQDRTAEQFANLQNELLDDFEQSAAIVGQTPAQNFN
jgi:hypothetical protein